jgi:hypothetical protein
MGYGAFKKDVYITGFTNRWHRGQINLEITAYCSGLGEYYSTQREESQKMFIN